MKNILTAASLGAFIMFFACAPKAAPSTMIAEPYNEGTKQERIQAVIGCLEDDDVRYYVTNKVKLRDEYEREYNATYHELLKQGNGRVVAKSSAEAIWFDLGEQAKTAERQADNAVQGCAKLKYNIDLK